MTTHIIPLYIEDKILDKYRTLMGPDPINYNENNLDDYSTVESWTVTFPDGTQMDIKLHSEDRENGTPLWTQGVLYNKMGGEDGCTDVMGALDAPETDYTVKIDEDDVAYTVKIFPESARPNA